MSVLPARLGSLIRRLTPLQGATLLAAALTVGGVVLWNKNVLATELRAGDTITADFARDYRLQPHVTKVKIAGVPVGVVTDVDGSPEGARVEMKLWDDNADRLGQEPSAAVRPTTLLGGNYYVDLRPGGDPGRPREAIPMERTTTPVELDRVLEALDSNARDGIRTSVGQLDAALANGGAQALGRLVDGAPATLGPAAEVLGAARGTRPGDLQRLVDGLAATARELTAEEGQLGAIVASAARVSSTLGDRSAELTTVAGELPETLRASRRGLGALAGTLDRLRTAATEARPVAREVSRLVDRAAPVVAAARPLLADLRPAVSDLRPALVQLDPAVRSANTVLADVQGPVLDRIENDVVPTVLRPAPGSDFRLYEDLVYSVVGLGAAAKYRDANGAMIFFHAGVHEESFGSWPFPSPFSADNTPGGSHRTEEAGG